ncbi:carboxypeptidase regulatory-like domain-containing protein [Actinacidiphila acidipaludis]|uniref:Carboxypeptidase-like regulatory domain-containing protein n=1 Tax=Actinacidiphila acidipaludis TaxID=2873382 RepID=A0ABS7QE20_9ACTN|nr:carboxypeptidase-like regulatory domain-containing protein [Streptomyces acidipaludis]MBY8881071.1 carboxypeptidase-like regulatory domain-containing protein [Streptomyces acidipaludis]
MHRRTRMWAAGVAIACAAAFGLTAAVPAQAVATASGGTPQSTATYKPAGCALPVPPSEQKGDAPYATCDLMGATNTHGALAAGSPAPPAGSLTPADFQAAYHLPSGGSGATVAIVDAGGYATAEADLAVFRSTYGLPACTTANGCFGKLDQAGGHNLPPENPDWSIETSLDLDAVSSVCPSCHILLVEADSPALDDLGEATDTAAAHHPVAISNSYGVPNEISTPEAYDHYYDHPGIAVTASTGDYGNIVNWPASNGNVVAVGGTTLTRDATTARGWTEAAWASGGSGCSQYEPRPAYQQALDTGCADRAIGDISADADPATGLGLYNSTAVGGWARYGGTSLSSPLVAAMYALAGTPTPGTYPVTYPYADANAADLNDVTAGSDGYCGNQLCTARAGWDGPTGLGSPAGVGALRQGPHGVVSGTVRATGSKAVTGATVTATGTGTGTGGRTYSATTDASGAFTLAPAPGSYTVTVAQFGYATATATLKVAAGGTAKETFTLRALPTHAVSGAVTDASGHGWPLAATVAVSGYPGTAVHTDPVTGRYTVRLPDNGSYTLHVSSSLPGYRAADAAVAVGTRDVRHDVTLPVDATACTAPGYRYGYAGTTTDFEGWNGATPQDGWTVTDDSGSGITWRFDDPGHYGNDTGGTGQFAEVDSRNGGNDTHETTTLVSPVLDMSGDATPIVSFANSFTSPLYNSNAYVEVSVDGGKSWTSVWHMARTISYGPEVVALPQAAGKSDVRVRFRYDAVHSWFWKVDDVFIGERSCDTTAGGLVAGTVTDANTGTGLTGATVRVAGTPADTTDAGAYELFAPASAADGSGRTALGVTDGAYTAATAKISVARDRVTGKDWRLGAGRIGVSGGPLRVTQPLGGSTTRTVTLRNTGTAPVHVLLSPQEGSYTPGSHAAGTATSGGARVRHAGGDFTRGSLLTGTPRSAEAGSADAAPVAGGTAWTVSDALPGPVMDSGSVTVDGKVYSFGGTDGGSLLFKASVHDPATGGWRRLANMPQGLEKPGVEAIGGSVYVFGGWDSTGSASAAVYRYDPAHDTWTAVAPLPSGVVAGGTAVLGGRLYVIAGCGGNCFPVSQATYVYDPGTDSWSQAADYPVTDTWLSCAGIDGQVVCAGGSDPVSGQETAATYAFDPVAGTWTARADLPYPNWAMSSASSGGRLQLVGGVSGGELTNQGEEYDPATDAWSALPAANTLAYRGSGACGLYVVGGSDAMNNPVTGVEQLPGYGDCGSSGSAAWLSAPHSVTVAPGATVTVRVAFDAGKVGRTGTYAGGLTVGTDSPYAVPSLAATMKVTARH